MSGGDHGVSSTALAVRQSWSSRRSNVRLDPGVQAVNLRMILTKIRAVGCLYLPQDPWLPSQPWWYKHESVNNLPNVTAQLCRPRVKPSDLSNLDRKSDRHHTVSNQPPKANSAFHPSGVGKWVPASTGKAKAGTVHSVSGWTRGVQVKLWDPLRTRAIPERLRGVFTTRRYTNPRLPYLILPWLYVSLQWAEPMNKKHRQAVWMPWSQ